MNTKAGIQKGEESKPKCCESIFCFFFHTLPIPTTPFLHRNSKRISLNDVVVPEHWKDKFDEFLAFFRIDTK